MAYASINIATYSTSNIHATTNPAQQTPNMPDLRSSMRTNGPAKTSKTVAFTRFGPDVRVIPDYMGTWAIGEQSLTASPWEELNVDRLWRESYAQASAMEKADAASASAGSAEDYFTSKHIPSSSANAGPRVYAQRLPVLESPLLDSLMSLALRPNPLPSPLAPQPLTTLFPSPANPAHAFTPPPIRPKPKLRSASTRCTIPPSPHLMPSPAHPSSPPAHPTISQTS